MRQHPPSKYITLRPVGFLTESFCCDCFGASLGGFSRPIRRRHGRPCHDVHCHSAAGHKTKQSSASDPNDSTIKINVRTRLNSIRARVRLRLDLSLQIRIGSAVITPPPSIIRAHTHSW